MKVGIITAKDRGGAGRATMRLSRALTSIGVLNDLLVKEKYTDKAIEINFDFSKYDPMIDYINQKYFHENVFPGNVLTSLMYSGINSSFLNKFKEYDVIHFHWIANFISIENMVNLDNEGKPLVWTFHDLNPMSGACHYMYECEKYQTDCKGCNQLKFNPNDITKKILAIKKQYMPKNLTIIAPSKWMADCARKSAVFKDNRIEVISNSIELDVFKDYDKKMMKEKIGVSSETKVIFFAAENHVHRHKGFEELIKAMQYVINNVRIQQLIKNNRLMILLVGEASVEIKQLGLPYISFGYIRNDEKLAQIFSAADVVALPSLEDNLPNIMLESLACGTPVVGFKTGGIPDCIINEKTGKLVDLKNVECFGKALVDILFGDDLNQECRKFAIEHFAPELQARQHYQLYADLVKNNQKKSSVFSVGEMFEEAREALMPYIKLSENEVKKYNELKIRKLFYKGCFEKKIVKDFWDNKERFFSLTKKGFAIWGTGRFAEMLIKMMEQDDVEYLKCLVGFFDGRRAEGNETVFSKYKLLEVSKIKSYDIKKIFIVALNYEEEIYKEISYLKDLGIEIIKMTDVYQ